MIVQAILTKYIGPSNVRGSRIKATASAGSVTVGYNHALNTEDNHKAAAEALRDKFGWKGDMAQGGLENGYAFVFTSREG